MKDNYRSWFFNPASFPREGSLEDKIKFLLKFAILAPSGHNSQPWLFRITGNSLEIHVNPSQALSESDPQKRQLMIGIGCAIENIFIASDYFGLKFKIQYFPSSSDENFIAKIEFSESLSPSDSSRALLPSILKRSTNRNPYQSDPLPESFLETSKGFENEEVGITFIEDKIKRDQIADLVLASQIEIMDAGYFRDELSNYVKSNYTKSGVGMPGFTQGIPGPVSLIAPWLIKKINFARKTYKKDIQILKNKTPAFLVISSVDDSLISKVKSGQIFERVWLLAESQNICLAPLAAPTQVGDYWRKVQGVIGLKLRPQIVARVGYCSKITRHTPRLSVDKVIIK